MSQYSLCTEDNLETVYLTSIEPFWQNIVQHGSFTGIANVDIAYAVAQHSLPVGSIVIASGRIESLIKYKELIYDLYQNGYSVFIHDHRGQGLSGRMLDNPHVGYVSSFNDYVDDFKKFIDEIVTAKSQHKPYLLCHSMGGAIGALTVLRYPELFQKVAFSAPMFGIRPALPNWLANLLLGLHSIISSSDSHFFGQKNYTSLPFVSNELTHSEVRYKIFRQEYLNTPQVQLGGVSGHWLRSAVEAMNEIELNVERFPISALVIQAGADHVVDNNRQGRVIARIPNATLQVIAGAKHELLAELDKYRVPCLTAILDFFKD
ncbi:alpha/beta fold hydrolase [Paraglaciecola arctica]|uniref:alpha/beta fold hydrolase n=1 Tax=Paraglaciecola arctica TaxID=1128911 RepID=UPI001C0762BD|nr:alpha/beta fold hydrolase [Paraglaciecola arctica]MBU3002557.1 alpha/beta fold hydrolase [Paraglaciecola arctica]